MTINIPSCINNAEAVERRVLHQTAVTFEMWPDNSRHTCYVKIATPSLLLNCSYSTEIVNNTCREGFYGSLLTEGSRDCFAKSSDVFVLIATDNNTRKRWRLLRDELLLTILVPDIRLITDIDLSAMVAMFHSLFPPYCWPRGWI